MPGCEGHEKREAWSERSVGGVTFSMRVDSLPSPIDFGTIFELDDIYGMSSPQAVKDFILPFFVGVRPGRMHTSLAAKLEWRPRGNVTDGLWCSILSKQYHWIEAAAPAGPSTYLRQSGMYPASSLPFEPPLQQPQQPVGCGSLSDANQ